MNSYQYKGMTLVLPEQDRNVRPYFEAAGRGVLVLPKCSACSLLRYPPGMAACPWCSSLEMGWQEVSGAGSIHSYVVVHHAVQPGFAADGPYTIALVELDVQRDRPSAGDVIRVPTNLVGPDLRSEAAERVAIGLRVDVIFEPLGDGLSIPKWKLVEGSSARTWRYPL